ncbi:hypothetical protein C0989_004476 [Termitomyces sp. Mn162]|nr:hypothetical protein C0989_004476 [Termitomyces sp. Mn162]
MLEVQKKSPCPKLTHPLSFYDCHLDRRLSLKNVKSIPSFLSDLAQSVNIALEKSSKDGDGLPSVDWCFPEPQRFTRFINRSPVKDAKDIGRAYRDSISLFACELASMLSLHPNASQWSTAIHMSVRCVSRHQKYYAMIEDYVPEILDSYEPIPEKAYAMVDKEAWAALSDDDRRLLEEMRARFTRMAVWQMFFACREAEDALKYLDRLLDMENFPEITLLTQVEEWAPTDTPLAASPDAVDTAWGTTVSSWVSEFAVHKNDHIPPAPRPSDLPLRRSNRVSSRVKLEPPLRETERKSKQTISRSSKLHWPTVTIPIQKRDLDVIDEDMTTSLIQHAWTRAVERDSSFIVFHCGTFERIGFRHRSSQTLILSDLIDVTNCKDPAYAHLQTGLFISIINDIRDRTRQVIAQEAKSKPAKRKGRVLFSENNKRPRTRRSVALEEARNLAYKQSLKVVCDGIADRDLAMLHIQHGPYNSPAPSSFLRIKDMGMVMPKKKYEPHEYFRVTITSEIAHGSTGDTHAATIDFLESSGKIVSFCNIVVKFAFASVQKKRLSHEFDVYSHLMSTNARGIPYVFGIFEDVETESLALIMEYAGLTLWDCRLPVKSKRLEFIISESEKSAYMDALKSIHDAGVRHRDLRLENLTIKSNGDPCIIDFDRAEMEADERSLDREKVKLQNVLDGRHEYRISRETTEEDPNSPEEWGSGTDRSSSPGFRIGVLR